VHDANGAASSEHANVAAASGDENVNDTLEVVTVPFGPASMDVSGAVVSTVHVRDAGVGSGPAPLTARTANVCDPSVSPESAAGDAQAPNGAPSSAHSNVALPSGELNANDALASATVPLGPPVMAVSGGVGDPLRTVHAPEAGVASTLPAGSSARTRNAWSPSGRSAYVSGETQAAKPAPSRLHWNVAVASGEVNANVAEIDVTVPVGPDVSDVSGAAVSTVNARVAGVGST
jgi:hypothetical protein